MSRCLGGLVPNRAARHCIQLQCLLLCVYLPNLSLSLSLSLSFGLKRVKPQLNLNTKSGANAQKNFGYQA